MSECLTIEEIHRLATGILAETAKAETHAVRCGLVMEKMKATSLRVTGFIPALMETLILLGGTHEDRVIEFAETVKTFASCFQEFGEAVTSLGEDHINIAELIVEVVEKAMASRQVQEGMEG